MLALLFFLSYRRKEEKAENRVVGGDGFWAMMYFLFGWGEMVGVESRGPELEAWKRKAGINGGRFEEVGISWAPLLFAFLNSLGVFLGLIIIIIENCSLHWTTGF